MKNHKHGHSPEHNQHDAASRSPVCRQACQEHKTEHGKHYHAGPMCHHHPAGGECDGACHVDSKHKCASC
jgi:hypothetical protein